MVLSEIDKAKVDDLIHQSADAQRKGKRSLALWDST